MIKNNLQRGRKKILPSFFKSLVGNKKILTDFNGWAEKVCVFEVIEKVRKKESITLFFLFTFVYLFDIIK